MWTSILAVLLGVAAVIVYIKGAKPEKPWGKPLLVILVLGAVLSVVLPRTRMWKEAMRPHVERYKSIKMLGEALRDDLNPGAKVVFIRYRMDPEMMMMEAETSEGDEPPTHEEMLQQRRSEVRSALESGLEFSVDVIGYDPPGLTDSYDERGQNADAFNEVLEKYADNNVDVIISQVGLPRNEDGATEIDRLNLNAMPADVVFATDVGLQYQPDDLKNGLEKGVIDAVVLHPSTKSPERIVVTKSNLGDLPAESPIK